MQLVYRMDVNSNFSAAKTGQSASEGIDRKSLVREFSVARCKDVIVYAAYEYRRLYREVFGREVQSQVSLQAVLGF